LKTLSTGKFAQQFLPLLLSVNAPTQRAGEAVSMLRGWDGKMSGESAEPLIYTAWIKALSRAIYADELGDMFDEVLDTRTLNNAKADFDQPGSFPATFGSRYRQIIDLSDLANSRFIIAPGISGNIFSPYYKHLVGKWANGEYVRLTGSIDELKSNEAGEFILHPE
jgi:acyl-homoserine lactone acylase PvdQ